MLIEDVVPERPGSGRGTSAHPDPLVDRRQVMHHRLAAEVELGGDLLVGLPFDEGPQDRYFAFPQPDRRGSSLARWGPQPGYHGEGVADPEAGGVGTAAGGSEQSFFFPPH